MAATKYFFALFFILLLCSIHYTQGRGGRGGGSRGGGSRGGSSSSSSSGSRGSSSSGSSGSSSSSSSSSSSRGSSSSGTQFDRSGSRSNNKPSPPKPSTDLQPKPSAPELPRVNPSAPRLPQSPGHSQPSNPHPYNPNFGQPVKPHPDSGVRENNAPSYGNAPPGNLPPYSPRENPPPYSPGNSPPFSPGNYPPYAPGNNPPYATGNRPPYPPANPPPYSPGNFPPYAPGNPPPYGSGPPGNPPPYAPGNPPSYGSGIPGNHPPYAPPPYGVNTGNIPQGPPYGQPPYGGVNRPNLPQGNQPPYGVNPGMPGHGIQPGSIPHGSQPSNFPYPRQPGMSYPPSGSGWPNYVPPGGFQASPHIKPYKKKGLLGGILSLGKKPKHHKIGSPVGSFGAPSFGGHGISPINMILPVTAMKKSHKPFFHSKHHYWVLPFAAAHHRTKWGGIDFDDDDYDRRCFRPRPPVGGSVFCMRTPLKLECSARCQDNYTFQDNSTELIAHCWHYSGHWNRSKFFPPCQPYCKPEECQNGGTCVSPGECRCSSEYRGDYCEHPIMNCDILKFARRSKISWVCSHSRNETRCRVRCRAPLVFETPAAEQYHCHLNGTWTPDRIPMCVEEARTTEGTTLVTEASQEEQKTTLQNEN